MAKKQSKKPAAKSTRSAPPANGWRETKLSDTAKIKVLAESNPYRGARAKRFVYRNGMTVEQAVEKGATRSDIRWDVAKGHVKLA